MALAHRGDLDAAATALTETLAAFPQDPLTAFELCLVEARRLRGREALKACRAALTINPHNLKAADLSAEIAEATLDAGAVIAALDPPDRAHPGDDPPARPGLRHAGAGRRDAAALVPERREGTPEDATDRYVRGLVLLATNRGEEALPLLQAAADELDKDAWAQIALADLLMDQGGCAQGGRRLPQGRQAVPPALRLPGGRARRHAQQRLAAGPGGCPGGRAAGPPQPQPRRLRARRSPSRAG
ncbi:MAG: hypothetical protein R3F43_21835 [bacterium]